LGGDFREGGNRRAIGLHPEGGSLNAHAVVAVQCDRNVGQAAHALLNQLRQALHVVVRSCHGQRGLHALTRGGVHRAVVLRQVAEVVLRVDDEKVDVCFHVGSLLPG